MKKNLFITFFLCCFLFMNNVNASDVICKESPISSTFSYHRLDYIDGGIESLTNDYMKVLELFMSDFNYESYFVSLEILPPSSGQEYSNQYIFYFYKLDSTRVFFTDGAEVFSLKHSSFVVYQIRNGEFFDGPVWTSGREYLTNGDIFYGNYKNSCTVDSLALFYSNSLVSFTDLSESFLVPTYGTQYTHQSLGSSAPIIVDNLLPELSSLGYLTLDLNVAPYLLLSLPSYDIEPFITKVYVKGQFCFTPVYEYGTLEKNNPSTNGCYVYDDYTAITISISEEDIKNHSVYYVSNYDNSIDSSIKINPSIFDYKFIYNQDNPTFTFDGKTYNIIPYDDLNTSAKTNTEDGVIPGQSCELGDLGCTAENDSNVSGFDNLIDNILDFGSSIWASVVNFMSLVTKLITVLPPDFQQVILICFTFGLIIGCVKIFIK